MSLLQRWVFPASEGNVFLQHIVNTIAGERLASMIAKELIVWRAGLSIDKFRTAVAVSSHRGTTRSRRPLPYGRTCFGRVRRRSFGRTARASATRAPELYRNNNIAWSESNTALVLEILAEVRLC